MSKQAEAVDLLRAMSAEDLEEHLRQQRRRLFEVRFQQAAGQVENHRQVREIRREIARTMTLQLELVRGHHLASDLVVEEELEEQPRPRRLRRGRRAEEPEASEGAAAAPVQAPAEEVVAKADLDAQRDLDEEAAIELEAEPADEPALEADGDLDAHDAGSVAVAASTEDPDEDGSDE